MPIKYRSITLFLTLCITVSFLSACGSSSDSHNNESSISPSISTGIFIDSAVEGLQYTTDTLSGTTNAAGEYQYLPGETVRFSIGSIILGSTLAKPVITPLNLVDNATTVNDPVVTNIVRLLLTLDADLLPDNGIHIPTETAAAAVNLSVDFTRQDFASDPGVISLLTHLSNQTTLVDEQTAQAHLATSLASAQIKTSSWGSMVWGSGSWQSKTLKE